MNKNPHIIAWMFVFFTVIFAAVLFIRQVKPRTQTIITPLAEHIISLDIPFLKEKSDNDSLQTLVQNTLQGAQGTYGVVIKNLRTDEEFSLNGHQVFQSGSLYKLWVMACAYDQIRRGALSTSAVLEQDIPILNEKFRIATEDAERTEGKITLSVSDALYQMITISDNYAALLLSEKVRLSNVAQFLTSHGFGESKVGTDGGTPSTTASDTALFFEKLYGENLLGSPYDQEMLDILKEQKLNNKIPKNLPDEVTVAHKTGELGYFTHDAGIVYTPFGDYIIVVLSESKKPREAEKTIADLSEAVYQYFTQGK